MGRTYKDIFQMNNYDFLKWIKETFTISVPSAVTTAAEMEIAAEQMLRLSAEYEYITEMASYAKVYCRELKRLADNDDTYDEVYEDMVDKKDIIENKSKAIKQAYSGISRAVSVKIENNQELKLTGGRVAA